MEARVLIVEDEALIALHLEQIITDCGHRVVGIAFDAEEARALAAREHLDLAFIDMRLRHGASGLEVAKHLRETYDVPSIMVSGNLSGVRSEAAGLQTIALIGKPFIPATIVGALELAIRELRGYKP